MTKWTALLSGALALLLTAGCMENAMLVNVEKDGSGTITYRVHMSQEIVDMMQGMAGMATMMGDAVPEGEAAPEVDFFKEMREGLADQFGEGVELESTRELENDQGWKGFEAVYAFADINKVKLHDIDPMKGEAEAPAAGAAPAGGQYTVVFTPGDVAELKLVPTGDFAGAAQDPAESNRTETAAAESDEIEENPMGDMMSQLPLEMIKPMVKGMRMSLVVSVNGEIVETNAKFRSEDHPNVITLMDMQMEKLLDHPNAAELLQQSSGGPDAAALAEMDIPGVQIEKPGTEILIRFK